MSVITADEIVEVARKFQDYDSRPIHIVLYPDMDRGTILRVPPMNSLFDDDDLLKHYVPKAVDPYKLVLIMTKETWNDVVTALELDPDDPSVLSGYVFSDFYGDSDG